jgi:hypothetical protein
MNGGQIIDTALENLENATQIKGKWTAKGPKELDGQVTLNLAGERLTLNMEIKTELRNAVIPQIIDYNRRFEPFLLVAERLYPKVKEELRRHQVAYLEANGNFYLKQEGKWFFIDVNPPLPVERDVTTRAFTRTGLKVVFELLTVPELLQKPYRYIAEQTETAVGNITNIVQGLKQEGFVGQVNQHDWQLINKDGLIQRWAEVYEKKLKPILQVGTFRLAADKPTWKDLRLNLQKTRWGGEPAGDILTNYLRPETYILYTDETRNDLIKNYKLIPDNHGPIKAYNKFWRNQPEDVDVVPPLLVYVDLINTGEKRCRETAQKIYDEYIRQNL